MKAIIVGGGIGGLTTALMLRARGIDCELYEQSDSIRELGVGINTLPHAIRELAGLGLLDRLDAAAIRTFELFYLTRHGQQVWHEKRGLDAGHDVPQFSIHRGDLQMVLLDAFIKRAGADKVITGWRCIRVEPEGPEAIAHFEDVDGNALPFQRGSLVISAEGIHSVLRKQLYPDEGPPKYSGINMWRGVTRWRPFLSGASMIRIGWHHPAKLLIYPIRNNVDAEGRQLVNWVCDIETPQYQARDWNRRGRLEDFLPAMADWHFDWLDVPQFISSSDTILEYPMVDQDPLPRWSFGRLTLLGDAAHPMYPRGANGAAQAILDCRALTDALVANSDPVAALKAYEAKRLPATSEVVLANRKAPPDAILHEVYRRTGDKPFKNIDDVISREELIALSESYKRVAGYDKERLKSQAR